MATTIRFKVRSGTASEWEAANPVLLDGEIAYDRTAKRLRIGDGATAWAELDYIEPIVATDAEMRAMLDEAFGTQAED